MIQDIIAPPQTDGLIDLTGYEDNQIDYARAMQVGSLVVLQMKVELPKNGHWGLGRLTRLLPNCDTDIVIASNVSAFRGIIDSDGTIRSLQPMTGVCIVDAVYTVRQ